MVRSPAPAVVVAVRAAAGTDVEAGDTVLILESMKMETPVKAPYAGRVREILVGVNSQVDGGGALLRIDRIEDGGARPAPRRRWSSPATRSRPPTDPRAQALRRPGRDARADHGLRRERRPRPRRCWTQLRHGARRRSPIDDAELLNAPRWTCWRPSPTSSSCPGTGRPARRSPATSGCTARASTSTPTCSRWTWSGRACRRRSAPGWPRSLAQLRRHRPRAEPRAGGGGLPGLPGAGAGRRPDPDRRRPARAVAHRACRHSPRAGAAPGRRGRRAAGGRDPAALPGGRRPGQEHPVRGLRAAAHRGRPRRSVYADVREDLAQLAADPAGARSTRSGSTALVASSGTAGPAAGRAAAHPRARHRADARGDEPAVLPDPRPWSTSRPSRRSAGPYVTGNFELGGDRLYLISTVADHDDLAGALVAINQRAGQVPSAEQPGDRHLPGLAGRAGGPRPDLHRAARRRCRTTAPSPAAAGSP